MPQVDSSSKVNLSEARPRLSLDDIAAFLVQLEPDDLSGLVSVREALSSMTTEESYPAAVQKILAQAIQNLEALIQGNVSDPSAAIVEAGRLIEAAMNAMEENGQKETAEPPPRVKPTTEDQPSESLPADADPSLLGDFITESRDYIQSAEAALLSLEIDPENAEAVNTVFRAFHTIKGSSAFLGLKHISELAHHAESLLSRIREGQIRCTGGYADLALRSVDMLKNLIQIVQDALGGEPMTKPEGYDELMCLLIDPEAAGLSSEFDEATEAPPRLGDILVAQRKAEREEVEAAAVDQGEQPIGVALVKSETTSLVDAARALRTQKRWAGIEAGAESSVRVRTERLDRLIDMVGELVIAQSMVTQDEVVVQGAKQDLLKKVMHTGKIVRELQDLSMSMRMVPLKPTFQKMARLVRDLAHKSSKRVNFITEGEDTEIDRNMVDVLNDPLVHLLRNAVDHGLESPDEREKNGKPKEGIIKLSAYHSGGNVVVEVKDDGKGLDRDKIIKKAISKGLIESDKAVSDSEVFHLIFEPGFSTAEKVTEVSGRGVGMDVVKRGIEALRGHIDIASEPGKGCTFSLRLPLTLAITDGMLVKVGDQRYIMPTINIQITFRPEAVFTIAGRGEMVMLRGELIPIFRLHRLFEIQGAIEEPTRGLLVVVGEGQQRCALLVDELLGQQQVVAKSLGKGIGKIPGVSGGAILGDGRVGLILDTAEIAALARQASS
ncbi:MAG: chemotaxis protein CheA [candidate division KSB1 bacterium]|nr:chemotaxis protein CheA [candidate division KSB1 bacterium]